MKFPIIELVDRYCIAKVKFEKTNGSNADELLFYYQQMNELNIISIETELEDLTNVHKTIWGLETELKSGREQELDLAEIGRRAIAIRNWNNKRIVLKNLMSKKLAVDNILAVKQDHLSE